MVIKRIFFISSLGVVAIVTIPIFFVLYSVAMADYDLWVRLYETRLKVLLWNTLKLLFSVGLLVLCLGVLNAWLVTRYEFWGRGFWEWALVLPFAMPGYIMAYAYTSLTAPGSPVETLFISLFGTPLNISIGSPYLWATLILSFINYPYVYLLVRHSFLVQNEIYEDVARVHGVSGWQKFRQVNLMLAYPGITAGLALALMEVLADFGTVSLLRYPTFTEAIYRQMVGRFDPIGASALATVLLFLSFLLLNIERYFRGKAEFVNLTGQYRPFRIKKFGPVGNILVNLYFIVFTLLNFFLPLLIILFWAYRALLKGALEVRLLEFTLNSLYTAFLGALLATILAFPIAFIYARGKGFLRNLLFQTSTLGYALPGPVTALCLLLFFSSFYPSLIGSFFLLPLAYVIRFISVAVQAQSSSLLAISKNVEEVGYTLGVGPLRVLTKVTLPLASSGLLTGFLIIFVDSIKELPATLMLRPLAFDTLSVRVYNEAVESLWDMASIPALFILLVSLLFLLLFLRLTRNGGYYIG